MLFCLFINLKNTQEIYLQQKEVKGKTCIIYKNNKDLHLRRRYIQAKKIKIKQLYIDKF